MVLNEWSHAFPFVFFTLFPLFCLVNGEWFPVSVNLKCEFG